MTTHTPAQEVANWLDEAFGKEFGLMQKSFHYHNLIPVIEQAYAPVVEALENMIVSSGTKFQGAAIVIARAALARVRGE